MIYKRQKIDTALPKPGIELTTTREFIYFGSMEEMNNQHRGEQSGEY